MGLALRTASVLAAAAGSHGWSILLLGTSAVSQKASATSIRQGHFETMIQCDKKGYSTPLPKHKQKQGHYAADIILHIPSWQMGVTSPITSLSLTAHPGSGLPSPYTRFLLILKRRIDSAFLLLVL